MFRNYLKLPDYNTFEFDISTRKPTAFRYVRFYIFYKAFLIIISKLGIHAISIHCRNVLETLHHVMFHTGCHPDMLHPELCYESARSNAKLHFMVQP